MSTLRGRFETGTNDDMQRFGSSIEVDLRMLEEDIDGSMAHVSTLERAGMLAAAEAEALRTGLVTVRDEIESCAWRPTDAHEDIHMAVETRLVALVGEVGKKLHTARSRNDQVATDVRLWLKRRAASLEAALTTLIGTMLDRVERDGETLMPGYTHLQRGQPILLGHHLLAHTWALTRDLGRLRDAGRRLDQCPLGACAMAGTPHPIDRAATASDLGFAGPVENAMDAVAARDHEQEIAAACAITMGHLSRMAEELVMWASAEVAFIRMGEGYATGSSIMPQKRNPDAAELVRGKAARVMADLQALLVLTKGLPMAYNRDLQEDREPLFHAVETTLASVGIMAGMWRTLEVKTARFDTALEGDFSLATELADALAARDVPFREAHEVVGRIVRWCEQEGVDLRGLTSGHAASFHPAFAEIDLAAWLDPRAAVARRSSLGGTAWSEVVRQVALLRAV